MTLNVKELIEMLKTCNQDSEVCFAEAEPTSDPVKGIGDIEEVSDSEVYLRPE
jgi:hypothetical protein